MMNIVESGGYLVDPATGECIAPRIAIDEEMLRPYTYGGTKEATVHWRTMLGEEPPIPILSKTDIGIKKLAKHLRIRRNTIARLFRSKYMKVKNVLLAARVAINIVETVSRRPTKRDLAEAWRLLSSIGLDESSKVWMDLDTGATAMLAALAVVMNIPMRIVESAAKRMGIAVDRSVMMEVSISSQRRMRALSSWTRIANTVSYVVERVGFTQLEESVARIIIAAAARRGIESRFTSHTAAAAALNLAAKIVKGMNPLYRKMTRIVATSPTTRLNAEIELMSLGGMYIVEGIQGTREIWLSEYLCRELKKLGVKPVLRTLCFEGDLYPYAGTRLAAREVIITALHSPESLEPCKRCLMGSTWSWQGIGKSQMSTARTLYERVRATHISRKMAVAIIDAAKEIIPIVETEGETIRCPLCGKEMKYADLIQHARGHISEIERLVDQVLDRVLTKVRGGG